MQATIPEDLITVSEAARLLRCRVHTVHRWIRLGQLPAWRRGPSRYLVSEADVRGMITPVVPEALPASAAERRAGHEAAVASLRAAGLKW